MRMMKVSGSCHCGEIAFEGIVDADNVAVCHCADCQRLTGFAFRANVQSSHVDFRLLRGNPKIYVKTADSGARRAHAFCSTCGTPIYSADLVSPKRYSLRIGTLEQRHELAPPKRQIWCKSSLNWSLVPSPQAHEGAAPCD